MNPKAVSRERARAVLAGEAFSTFWEWIDQARAKFGRGRIDGIAANAQRCLEAALAGIEDWLDAVYNQGMDPEEADFYFLGDSDACTGLGHSAPSQIIDRKLGVFADWSPEMMRDQA